MANSVTDADIYNAVSDSHGFIAPAARRLGISRGTIYNRIKDSPFLQEMIADLLEELKDRAEMKLHSLIDSGELGAICFFLKCKAKDRGYIEQQNVKLSGGEAIKPPTIVVNFPDEAKDAKE